jgi:hypothetical protein
MRRGLFALPVPVFVFLAYNAKVPQAYEGDAVRQMQRMAWHSQACA